MSAPNRLALVASGFFVVACATPRGPAVTDAPPAITNGRELIGAMHARYAGRYLTTLSFLQNNTLYQASGGEQKTQWLEHLAVPGRLRIDHLPLANHSGVIYEGGRVHVFDNGKQTQSQPGVNPLLLLGFDVYAQPPELTSQALDSLGFDLAVIRDGQWQGRRVHIVGADVNDSTTNQFWVDAERLLFVRMVQRNRTGTIVTDYRFDRYIDVGGFPIAIEVLMLRNGRAYFKEEYTNVRVNIPIPDAVFDPARWVSAQPAVAIPPSGATASPPSRPRSGSGAPR